MYLGAVALHLRPSLGAQPRFPTLKLRSPSIHTVLCLRQLGKRNHGAAIYPADSILKWEISVGLSPAVVRVPSLPCFQHAMPPTLPPSPCCENLADGNAVAKKRCLKRRYCNICLHPLPSAANSQRKGPKCSCLAGGMRRGNEPVYQNSHIRVEARRGP